MRVALKNGATGPKAPQRRGPFGVNYETQAHCSFCEVVRRRSGSQQLMRMLANTWKPALPCSCKTRLRRACHVEVSGQAAWAKAIVSKECGFEHQLPTRKFFKTTFNTWIRAPGSPSLVITKRHIKLPQFPRHPCFEKKP